MMTISFEDILKKMAEREKCGGRAIFWSISTDMKDLVILIKCNFEVNDDQAKKLALKVVKKALAI